MPRRPSLLPVLAACLALAACSSTPTGSRVDRLIADGRFEEALEVAARRRDAAPENAEAVKEHRRASVAYLIDRARQATFEDRDEEALELLLEAGEIAPENVVVQDWIRKAHVKLADLWLDQGLDLESQGELAAARDAYENALEHVPDGELARAGVARVLLLMNYRAGLGEEYYREGVARMREALLLQARQNLDYAQKYTPDHELAQVREADVLEQLASERIALARTFETKLLFPAANTEYRLALLLDPQNEAAQAGLERTQVEARAAEAFLEADMLVRKDRLEEAQEALQRGLEVTSVQTERFSQMQIAVQESRLRRLYERAYDLETDFRYPEAVEAYSVLLEEAEFYEDAIARRKTLQDYIERAATLYASAQSATSDEVRLDLLRQIEVFWPEYRDVEERIRDLESPGT